MEFKWKIKKREFLGNGVDLENCLFDYLFLVIGYIKI
jgi:hypothetical protein